MIKINKQRIYCKVKPKQTLNEDDFFRDWYFELKRVHDCIQWDNDLQISKEDNLTRYNMENYTCKFK